MNISKATRKALSRYPYIEEYLSYGIINTRGIARLIRKEVKSEVGTDINIQSIVTAVRRYPASKERLENSEILKILSKSELNLRYDISVLNIKSTSIEKLRNIRGDYMILMGIHTLTVVGEDAHLLPIRKIFKDDILMDKKDLSSVIVRSPANIAKTPGVIAHLANILAIERINVIEMMSSYTETVFIVEEKDALKTLYVIRDEMKRARG